MAPLEKGGQFRWTDPAGEISVERGRQPLTLSAIGAIQIEEVAMEMMPWGFFVFASVFNLVLIAVAIWFVWTLVSALRGIHQELTRIRQHIVSRQDESSLSS